MRDDEGLVFGERWIGARASQEDYFLVESAVDGDTLLCVLADGMGGHAAGEVASEAAVSTFRSIYVGGRSLGLFDRLRAALDAGNDQIAQRVAEDQSLAGMGCTLVGVVKTRNHVCWISVGDSPFWRYNGARLIRLNADHSIKGELEARFRRGEIARSDIDANPDKHVLTSALIGGPIRQIDLDKHKIEDGDRFVLASDGIETLTEFEIEDVCAACRGAPPRVLVDALLEAVRRKGDVEQDNTTIIVFDQVADETPTVRASASQDRAEPKRRPAASKKRAAGSKIGLAHFLLGAGFTLVGVVIVSQLVWSPEPPPPAPATSTSTVQTSDAAQETTEDEQEPEPARAEDDAEPSPADGDQEPNDAPPDADAEPAADPAPEDVDGVPSAETPGETETAADAPAGIGPDEADADGTQAPAPEDDADAPATDADAPAAEQPEAPATPTE